MEHMTTTYERGLSEIFDCSPATFPTMKLFAKQLEDNYYKTTTVLASLCSALTAQPCTTLLEAVKANSFDNEANFKLIISTLKKLGAKIPVSLFSETSEDVRKRLGLGESYFKDKHAITFRTGGHANMCVIIGDGWARLDYFLTAEILLHETCHCISGILCRVNHIGQQAEGRVNKRCTPIELTQGIECAAREAGFAVEQLTRGFSVDQVDDQTFIYSPCGKKPKRIAYLMENATSFEQHTKWFDISKQSTKKKRKSSATVASSPTTKKSLKADPAVDPQSLLLVWEESDKTDSKGSSEADDEGDVRTVEEDETLHVYHCAGIQFTWGGKPPPTP